MANLTVNLPAPAGNGTGAAQNTAALAGYKTIVCTGTFRGTVTVEVSEDGGTTFAPIATFENRGDEVLIEVAANRMRVRRSGVPVIDPGTPQVDVLAEGISGIYTTLAVPAGNGAGASSNVSAMPTPKTVTVAGSYTGSLFIQISPDDINWTTVLSFSPGVTLQTQKFTALFMRVVRSGVGENPGTPVVAVGAVDTGAGGGGGSGYTLQTIEVSPNASTSDPAVTANLPDGTTLSAEDEVNVKNITEEVGLIDIQPVGAQTIDGEASLVVAGPLISIRLNWDGVSNWRSV